MRSYDNPLTALARRVQRGDPEAATRLGQELEPHVACAAWRVLHFGPRRENLEQLIARELTRYRRPPARGAADEAALVTQVSRRVCAALVDDLRRRGGQSPALQDTVRGL